VDGNMHGKNMQMTLNSYGHSGRCMYAQSSAD